MQKKWMLILVLAAAGVALWFWLRDDETKRVRRTVDALASVCSRSEGESVTGLALKAQQLEGLLAPEIVSQLGGDFPVSGSWTRSELVALAAQIRATFKSIAFTVHDVTVTLEDATHATAVFTARFRGVQSGGGVEEVRPLTSRLVKLEGRWRFAAFAEQAVLRK